MSERSRGRAKSYGHFAFMVGLRLGLAIGLFSGVAIVLLVQRYG